MNALWEIVQTRLVRRSVPIKNFKVGDSEAAPAAQSAGYHDSGRHPDRGGPRDREVHQGAEAQEGAGVDSGRPGPHHLAVEGRPAGGDATRCANTTSASRCSSATTASVSLLRFDLLPSLFLRSSFPPTRRRSHSPDRACRMASERRVGLRVERQLHFVADSSVGDGPQLELQRGTREELLELRLERRRILRLHRQRERLPALAARTTRSPTARRG